MSIPIGIDNSIQSNFKFTPTGSHDLIITSYSLYTTPNTLQTAINTNQPTLTGATSLLGDGANITNLIYAKDNNKPTNFQSD